MCSDRILFVYVQNVSVHPYMEWTLLCISTNLLCVMQIISTNPSVPMFYPQAEADTMIRCKQGVSEASLPV